MFFFKKCPLRGGATTGIKCFQNIVSVHVRDRNCSPIKFADTISKQKEHSEVKCTVPK